MVSGKRMLAELMELTRIASPSRREAAVAEVVMAKLRGMGLRPRRDSAHRSFGGEVGNVIVRVPGSRRGQQSLLLNAHLDTVAQASPVQARVAGKYIVSSGDAPFGADDKVGVVAILEALRCVAEDGIEHPPLDVIFTVGEEAGLLGAKGLDPGRLRAGMGFTFDSGGRVGRIVNQAPSQDSFTAVITGRAAHAGVSPEKGVNAIRIAARAIAGMRQGRIDRETTANVGIIEGGVATNIVPERVRLEGEARSHNNRKLERQLQHMLKRIHDAAAEGGGGIDIEVRPQYRRFGLAADSPTIEVAERAVRAVGRRMKLETTGGGSDANIFNQHGVPTAILGCGYDNPHSASERMEIGEFAPLGRLTVALIRSAAAVL
ncbi:MAG: M20/M25/M40 family metallo-hydrolase [Armatimonadota bacterium]|nr:MAG: M20/M25/M40 family metallo-hydrolase [Armatimonadota bacterium]